jgi:TRAP transporter 4TM/12TM fusion protein
MQVIKHAFLPALLSYIALMYLVHLEAVKAGMQGKRRLVRAAIWQRLLSAGLTLSGTALFFLLAYWIVGTINSLFGAFAFYLNSGLILVLYLLLIYCEVRCDLRRKLHSESGDLSIGEALLAGLHYLLPIMVLVWCLMLLRLSPATSVFYAIVLMIVIQLTQEPLRAYYAGRPLGMAWRHGGQSLVRGLENGARNMIGIGVATATAGIVDGTVRLTGIGQVLGELIETLSFGSVLLMLLLTALICMVLGMGLPTTANYIVVSTLMAPVIVQLAAAHGLDIPLVAVHMFVFYFGILADDTPPVGLAAYAAAGISGGDPIRTGLQSFYYDIRTAILPFMFIFNNQLLLIGVDSLWAFVLIAGQGLVAMLLFVSATQGWLLTRNHRWESLLLLLIAFSLFRPGYWRDQFYPAQALMPAVAIESHLTQLRAGDAIRLQVEVEEDDGSRQLRDVRLQLPEAGSSQGLSRLGFITEANGDSLRVRDITFMSPAEMAGLEPGYTLSIKGYYSNLPQPPKGLFLLPPLLLLSGVGWLQYRRRDNNTTQWEERDDQSAVDDFQSANVDGVRNGRRGAGGGGSSG